MLCYKVSPCMQEALVVGSLEGLVVSSPRTTTPGPAQAGTLAKTGSGSRAASKRKLAAGAAAGALPRSLPVGRGPGGACLAWPTRHAVRHPSRLNATDFVVCLTLRPSAQSLHVYLSIHVMTCCCVQQIQYFFTIHSRLCKHTRRTGH